MDSMKQYMVDNEPMSMKQMRHLVDKYLGHGPVAKHYPIQEIIRLLEQDGRTIKVII